MQEVRSILEKEMHQIDNTIKILEQRLSQYPDGALQISHCKGKTQYYYREGTSEDSKKRRVYIKKENEALAKRLAQKDYDKKLLKHLKAKQKQIKIVCDLYEEADSADIYEELHPDRKRLVEPLYITDEEYAKQWQETPYQRKTFAEGIPEIYTVKGERVRSKSEKILADTFEREGIPYRYEYPVKIKGGRTIYPDFLLLNKNTRKEYYLEHLGMMDDPEYAASAIRRIEEMGKCGIILGKNLLLTAETRNHPLDTRFVRTLIQELRI